MQFEEIKSLLQLEFPKAILGEKLNATPKALLIDIKWIHQVCRFLHGCEKTYFDTLSSLSGIDNGPDQSMEVLYHLYSIPYNLHLALGVELNRKNPEIASVSDIWKAADWHEREAYDLLGVNFLNHPDLRRILMPEDWEGYPLRKDYEPQDTYHDIKVKY